MLIHALFADDIFIFCRGDTKSLFELTASLEEHGKTSRQRVNKAKSVFFFMGQTVSTRKHNIQTIFRFAEGSLPFKYLGVPIFKGCPKRQRDRARSALRGGIGFVRFEFC